MESVIAAHLTNLAIIDHHAKGIARQLGAIQAGPLKAEAMTIGSYPCRAQSPEAETSCETRIRNATSQSVDYKP